MFEHGDGVGFMCLLFLESLAGGVYGSTRWSTDVQTGLSPAWPPFRSRRILRPRHPGLTRMPRAHVACWFGRPRCASGRVRRKHAEISAGRSLHLSRTADRPHPNRPIDHAVHRLNATRHSACPTKVSRRIGPPPTDAGRFASWGKVEFCPSRRCPRWCLLP